MKNIIRNSVAIQFLFLAIVLISCGGDEAKPSTQDKVRKLLTSGTWNVQSVTVDNLDAIEFFEGAKVTFTKNGFTSVNGAPVWPASGTWSFGNTEATKIVRADGVEITITLIDENTFACNLYWDENIFEGGRSNAVEGEHFFVFVK
jgi:hypothetical protein